MAGTFTFTPVLAAAMLAGAMLVTNGAVEAKSQAETKQAAADAQIAKIGDPVRYLASQREKIAAAKAGNLSDRDVRRLNDAEKKMTDLVSGRENLNDLDPSERVIVFNAQETIAGIASGHDNSRLVCKRRKLSGTRIGSTQCMTAEQAEAQSRSAREAVHDVQRETCVPGEGSSCG